MKLLSLFSGIGAFEKALDRLQIPYTLAGFSEIDKFAIKSYCKIHDVLPEKNLGDITKIDCETLDKDIDLISYGFPCQDISIVGHKKGFYHEDGKVTRSGLFFEALRIIEHTKPKVAIAENVKNLTSKSFTKELLIVLTSLEEAGYNNYWQVLNAKDYGIPQNRERLFIVSIRQDIDNKKFKFPNPIKLEKRLKDMLDDEVDEKYYLTNKQIEMIKNSTYETNRRRINTKEYCYTLTARDYKDPKCIIAAKIKDLKYEANARVHSQEGLSPALQTCGGGQTEAKVLQNERVRKLTPKEYYRLMGFDDVDFEKAAEENSNSQLYKQAGNSIVVDCLMHLLKSLADTEVIESMKGTSKC